MKSGVSVVVPVYNSERSLPELIERLEKVLGPGTFEAVLVNDGSRDGSWEVVRRLAGERRWVRGINLMRNYGQHNALLCGIRAARYDTIVTMDDDLQNPPEEVPALLKQLEKDYDVVYGTPQKQRHGLWRGLASWFTKLALQKMMGAQTARSVGPFRAFRTRLRSAFQDYRGSYVSIDVLLTWATSRFGSISVRHDPRKFGVTNYTFGKLASHALDMTTGSTMLPLQIATLLGFAFAFFGLLVLVYVVGRYFIQGGGVPGFPFLASTIAIFSGVQLFALGIIGEYILRIHVRMMDRPCYAVRDTLDAEGA